MKEPKILFMKLLPYKSDKEVQEILDMLEKNIYSDTKIEIDKKRVKDIILKYELK